jgi:hypothetical protein
MPSIHQPTQSARWCFTLNNYTLGDIDLFYDFKDFRMAMGQMEIGINNTKHIQGWFVLLRPNRLTWLKSNLHPTCHFEKMKGSLFESYKYCSKEDTRDPDYPVPWFYPTKSYVESQCIPKSSIKLSELIIKKVNNEHSIILEDRYILHKRNVDESALEYKRHMKEHDLITALTSSCLYPWQQLIEILLLKQTNRQIHWIHDPEGNSGKSWFMSYMYAKHNWLFFDAKTKLDSTAYLIIERDPPGICFDIPRSDTMISWSSLEQLKNGMISCTKYRGYSGPIGSKKIVVFSNAPPHVNEHAGFITYPLSIDRYRVYFIKNNSLQIDENYPFIE